MKKGYIYIIISLCFLCIFCFYIKDSDIINVDVDNNITTIDMIDNNNLSVKVNDKIKLKASVVSGFNNRDDIYNWESSNKDVASVNNNGVVTTNGIGNVIIEANIDNKTIKVNLDVYDVRKIIVIVGDSRMDQFKDDNNFSSTSKYQVKYKNGGLLDNFYKAYVVSHSGMKYDWLVGSGEYKDDNATDYVEEIINNYETKTTNYVKYDIKILFNLGVNDLNRKYLDGNVSDIALNYLNKLDNLLNKKWSNDVINNISLNMITLFPINDEQVKCYFPMRFNEDVIEYNKVILNNSKYHVCDAYNDLDFNPDVYREKTSNEACAVRDGLHFSPEFNTKVLYTYLVDYCASK